MKNKDDVWVEEKLKSIKKRKRMIRHVQDAPLAKKLKKDLKREERSVKRARKQAVNKEIKNILDELS